MCAEADEKGSNGIKCHLKPLGVQLLPQVLHLLPGPPLNFLQLLQLLLQGCSMLADEGLAVCLTPPQGPLCQPQLQ